MSSSRCRNCTCGPKEAGRPPRQSPHSQGGEDFHFPLRGELDPILSAAEGMGVLGSGSRTFFNLDSKLAGQNLQIECLVFLGS